MIRLAVTVEGWTEEEFINTVLCSHLQERKIDIRPILIGKAGGARGGNIERQRIVADISMLVHSFDAVTTLVDYYGFANRGNISVKGLEDQIMEMALKKLERNFNQNRLFPYVQQYEFEGLLFSNVTVFDEIPDVTPDVLGRLHNIRNSFDTPEDINDSRNTAPSKRISKELPKYDKTVEGPLLADSIGLSVIQKECPRFNKWIERIEQLPNTI